RSPGDASIIAGRPGERRTRPEKWTRADKTASPPDGMHSFAKAFGPARIRLSVRRGTSLHATILEAPRRLGTVRAWMDWSVDEPCRSFARGDGALHRRKNRGAIGVRILRGKADNVHRRCQHGRRL